MIDPTKPRRIPRWPFPLVASLLLGCSPSADPLPMQASPPALPAVGSTALAVGSALPSRAPSVFTNRARTSAVDATSAPRAHELREREAFATPPTARDVTAALQNQETSNASEPVDSDWDPGWANRDPNDDAVVGPPDAIADCHERLRAAGVVFREAQLPILQRRGFVCGAPQVVEYIHGPERIQFRPRPIVTCQLALSLARLERLLNRTADEFLGAKVVSVRQGGTYNCRSMARFRLVSEHSYANAIDLYGFGLSDARTVSVVKHFGRPGDVATTAEARFLRTLARRAFDEDVFSVVVTRYFDELHRDHFHVDMARYRTDGSR